MVVVGYGVGQIFILVVEVYTYKKKDPILIPFVTTYDAKHFNIFQEAKKNFSIKERDQEIQQLIKKSDLLHSQRHIYEYTIHFCMVGTVKHKSCHYYEAFAS